MPTWQASTLFPLVHVLIQTKRSVQVPPTPSQMLFLPTFNDPNNAFVYRIPHLGFIWISTTLAAHVRRKLDPRGSHMELVTIERQIPGL